MTFLQGGPKFEVMPLVLGKGFRGRRIEWRYFWFDNIQDGG